MNKKLNLLKDPVKIDNQIYHFGGYFLIRVIRILINYFMKKIMNFQI